MAQAPTDPVDSARPVPASRAVLRDIEPGSTSDCLVCGERLFFRAKERLRQVICNVYADGAWRRVEHYHPDCYDSIDGPHGDVDVGRTSRVAERMALREAG